MRADQKGFDRVEGANSAPKVEKKNTEIVKTTNADVDNTLHRNIGVKDLQIQQPGANRYKNTLMRRLIDPPSRQADKIMGREGHLATKGFDFGTIWPGNLPGYEHWQQQYDEYERRTVAEERLHPEPYDPKPAKVSVRPIVIGCGIMIATCFFYRLVCYLRAQFAAPIKPKEAQKESTAYTPPSYSV